jgi:UDP-2,3-diacylglucosamine pyrophosphatase LpxH
MSQRKYYETIVLSDIHLGSEHSRTGEVTEFLSQVDCNRLILNGDIIDGWQLKKTGKHWKQTHTDFFKVLMKMMEKKGTEIIYVRGNHDDFLDKLAPFHFSTISIVKDYILESHGRRYLVIHGDIFDTITTNMRWLAMLGDIGYTFLLWVNKKYNRRRERQGKEYFSLSKQVKNKVKSAVSYISSFEKELVDMVRLRKLDGVICGHIHQAANRWYDGIHYMNSGDWVESMTALVEDEDGKWEILTR